MAVVNTGFDPLFGDPLRKLIERAKAEGYDANIISGVRDDETQRQLVANAAATRAGQPLPYPDRGPVRKAAAVGYSPHEYGAAGDVSGIPQAELQRLAPQVGLNTIPDDPGHVELANWRQVAAAQPPPTPWSESDPANVPARMAMNVDAPAGMTLSSNPFVNSLTQIESGNRNIFSGVDKDYPGQPGSRSQGFAQIDVPTWQQFAPRAGIDINKFPTPMNADRDVQLQVAAQIPLGRFGGRTQKMLGQQFGQLDTSKTIGQLASQFGGAPVAGGPGPGNVGPVTGFLPGQSTGQGGIGSDAVASKDAAAPAAPSIASQIAGPIKDLGKELGDSGDQKQQGGDQAAQQALQAQQAAAAYGQQRQAMLQQQAAQLMAATMAHGQKALSWGSAPPGAATGLQRPPMATEMWGGVPIPMPGPTPTPGTTLNSMGDPYGFG